MHWGGLASKYGWLVGSWASSPPVRVEAKGGSGMSGSQSIVLTELQCPAALSTEQQWHGTAQLGRRYGYESCGIRKYAQRCAEPGVCQSVPDYTRCLSCSRAGDAPRSPRTLMSIVKIKMMAGRTDGPRDPYCMLHFTTLHMHITELLCRNVDQSRAWRRAAVHGSTKSRCCVV